MLIPSIEQYIVINTYIENIDLSVLSSDKEILNIKLIIKQWLQDLKIYEGKAS